MPAVYEWYQRGLALLRAGDAHAAATLLERAVAAEPDKGSIREALARAYYGARQFAAALEQFTVALDISPVNDYAHFGAGLCLGRLGRLPEAVGHLRMANVMHPDNSDYEKALSRYEAQLHSQREHDSDGALDGKAPS
jgi:tetratricopeptide (TPR) repeat protein